MSSLETIISNGAWLLKATNSLKTAGYVPAFASCSMLWTIIAWTTKSGSQEGLPSLMFHRSGTAVGETLLGTDGKTYAFYVSRIGGTSVASPVFAGIEADAEQAARHPIGFANPAIYALDGVKSLKAFHDVTDHPGGVSALYEVRSNYSDPATEGLPLNTYLRELGRDGIDATLNEPASATVTIPLKVVSALTATTGYDDATGGG